MAREIKLTGISDHFEQKVIDTVRDATLRGTELIKKATPNAQPANVSYRTTGNLFRSWQTEIKPFQGAVFTDVEYAEPVAYGTNLPKSWGGKYRTNQGTIKGYPELVAKQLEEYIKNRFRKS
tara:strand:- start:505 stop:870 length:366 start_codon:yes stop_codon:yes gene_type:complete